MGTRTPKPKQKSKPKKSSVRSMPSAPESKKHPEKTSTFLKGNRIYPDPIEKGAKVADLIDNAFTSYNAGRLREACRLMNEKMLADNCTVGMSLSGALTPTGMGKSVLIPMIQAGFIDWMISTGANLYHDVHFGIGLKLHHGSPTLDDTKLRAEGVVRIYDILFDYHVLLDTDRFFRTVLPQPEFSGPMSSAEFHNRVGKYVHETEKKLGIGTVSLASEEAERAGDGQLIEALAEGLVACADRALYEAKGTGHAGSGGTLSWQDLLAERPRASTAA